MKTQPNTFIDIVDTINRIQNYDSIKEKSYKRKILEPLIDGQNRSIIFYLLLTLIFTLLYKVLYHG